MRICRKLQIKYGIIYKYKAGMKGRFVMKIKSANKEIVVGFLNKENAERYDFKLENDCLSDIENNLERLLVFKRKSTKVPDPDASELTMSIMCYLLEMHGYNVSGYEGRHIYLDNNIIVETDTANSFITLYKGALMRYVPNYLELCNELGINGGFMQEYEKIFENRDKFSLKKNNDKLLREFEEFAGLTHAIGNFIIGPKGFNAADRKSKSRLFSSRSWTTFDRVDLFLRKVSEGNTYKEWEQWFEKNICSTYLNFYYKDIVYLDKQTVDLKKSVLQDLGSDDFISRICLINKLIISRGAQMVSDLKTFLNV